jgi:hypothetical protein
MCIDYMLLIKVCAAFACNVCHAEMSAANTASHHQSPRAAALAARKLLDTVGEEHNDIYDHTSSSSDILHDADAGNSKVAVACDETSDNTDEGTTIGTGPYIVQ